MSKAILQLDTLTCPSCALKIESAVKSLSGVDKNSVNVLFNSSKVKLEFDKANLSIDTIAKTISDLGYDVLKSQVKE